MMTVWAGRLTPHARVAVDTSTCTVAKRRNFRKLHRYCTNGMVGRQNLHHMPGHLRDVLGHLGEMLGRFGDMRTC